MPNTNALSNVKVFVTDRRTDEWVLNLLDKHKMQNVLNVTLQNQQRWRHPVRQVDACVATINQDKMIVKHYAPQYNKVQKTLFSTQGL